MISSNLRWRHEVVRKSLPWDSGGVGRGDKPRFLVPNVLEFPIWHLKRNSFIFLGPSYLTYKMMGLCLLPALGFLRLLELVSLLKYLPCLASTPVWPMPIYLTNGNTTHSGGHTCHLEDVFHAFLSLSTQIQSTSKRFLNIYWMWIFLSAIIAFQATSLSLLS